MKTIFHHPQIGAIEFCTRQGLKHTNIRVSAQRVSISTSPLLEKTVFPLSAERVQWILDSQLKLRNKAGREKQLLTPATVLRTLSFSVTFQPQERLKTVFSAHLFEGNLQIVYRSDLMFESEPNQLALKRILSHFLRKEAQVYLPVRLQELAQQYGFQFSGVKINSARYRWGSCSARKQINLSFYLMYLSADLVDFVLVHELCHTEQMNHGLQFKKRMRSIFENYIVLNNELKKESMRLHSLTLK